MNLFSNYHPAVIFLYFLSVLVVNIVIFDPAVLLITWVSQAILCLYVKGRGAGSLFLCECLGLVLACAGINALVNHRGVSVLFFLWGLPVTAECLFYGLLTGLLLADSILSFSCYHEFMSSEKMMCLFGNRFPSFSLIFSMVLGLVPKIKRDYRKIRENHRIRPGIVSTIIGLSLEDAIEMGISMKNRGYGTGRRTSIYHRSFSGRDSVMAGLLVFLAVMGVGIYMCSGTGIEVFPAVEYAWNPGGVVAYACFGVLFNLPMCINAKEELRWRHIVSKI